MRIISIIITIIMYFVYLYLRNLNNCACVNQEYASRLKNIMSIFIFISVISLIINVVSPISLLSFNDTKKHLTLLPVLIFVVGYIYIYGYFVYDTYMFSSTMQVPCACADGWEKWYLYLESFVCGILLISIFGISSSLMVATNFKKGFIEGFYQIKDKLKTK